MEKGLIFMVVGVVLFICAAIALAVYGVLLSKRFPKTVKAKVTRIETLSNGKYKYHFECKSDGRRIMEDVVAYKNKNFKVGDKITVRMGKNGNTCHSNFPIWPVASSVLCAVLAAVVALSYFADKRNEQAAKEANQIYQETGYYIVTDTTTYFYGDNIGLTTLNRNEDYISTGDYGNVIFLGIPKYESGSIIPTLNSAGSNISVDGTPEDLPDDVLQRIQKLGHIVNFDVTDSTTLIDANKELDEHDHDHDHVHEEEEIWFDEEFEELEEIEKAIETTETVAEETTHE